MHAQQVSSALQSLADSSRAAISQSFFKTGGGQYGEGDIFLGITVPILRKEAKKYYSLPLVEIDELLHSPFHEVRLCALYILIWQFSKSDEAVKEAIFTLYLRNSAQVNNWDLVDSSAHLIVGPWLETRDRSVLTTLAHSSLLWERRIAILATFHYIRLNDFHDTLHISSLLLHDKEDLIHKAVGWMLREVGKRDQAVEESFLVQHYHTMPRTMLRYAIERFDEKRRKAYLLGEI